MTMMTMMMRVSLNRTPWYSAVLLRTAARVCGAIIYGVIDALLLYGVFGPWELLVGGPAWPHTTKGCE